MCLKLNVYNIQCWENKSYTKPTTVFMLAKNLTLNNLDGYFIPILNFRNFSSKYVLVRAV